MHHSWHFKSYQSSCSNAALIIWLKISPFWSSCFSSPAQMLGTLLWKIFGIEMQKPVSSFTFTTCQEPCTHLKTLCPCPDFFSMLFFLGFFGQSDVEMPARLMQLDHFPPTPEGHSNVPRYNKGHWLWLNKNKNRNTWSVWTIWVICDFWIVVFLTLLLNQSITSTDSIKAAIVTHWFWTLHFEVSMLALGGGLEPEVILYGKKKVKVIVASFIASLITQLH